MKTMLLPIVSCLVLLGCSVTVEQEDVLPVEHTGKSEMSYFNERNIWLSLDQTNCLLANWRSGIYQDETPVAFRVIDDDSTYRAFFNCKESIRLMPIDFTKYTLLVGTNASIFSDTPVGIRGIKQELLSKEAGLIHRVTVRGYKNNPGGGEWFGFVSLVSKIDKEVALEMVYQYE